MSDEVEELLGCILLAGLGIMAVGFYGSLSYLITIGAVMAVCVLLTMPAVWVLLCFGSSLYLAVLAVGMVFSVELLNAFLASVGAAVLFGLGGIVERYVE